MARSSPQALLRVELLEDRLAPVVSLSIANSTLVEGATGPRDMVFMVSLAMPSPQQVTVNFATANSTAVGLRVNRVVSGLNKPLFVTAPAGDTGRLFLVQQGDNNTASIRILNRSSGTVTPTPFLTLTDVRTGEESGLLGLAFHPNHASNGLFYIAFNSLGDNVVLRSYRTLPGNPDVADPASALDLLAFPHPNDNHNGGWLAFGPDGYLYQATGDGGPGGDPADFGQRRDVLLGKVLRIDINSDAFPEDPLRNYAIPPTNPFVNDGDPNTLGEIWAYGLRNPWRNSIDRLTGDLYIADVGQKDREEVNLQPGGSPGGQNYEWRIREGTIQSPHPLFGGPRPPGGIDPIIDYDRSLGSSVTGGYAYRGPIAELQGMYFFGDFISGRVWSLRWDGTLGVAPVPGGNNFTDFIEWTNLLTPNAGTINLISSFGEDPQGNLYLVDYGGEVFQLGEGADYLPTSGQLTFAPNETIKTVTVRVLGDRLDESNETFLVTLSNAVNATIDNGQAVGTIGDDDTAGTLQFSAAAFLSTENSGPAVVTVTRTGGSDGSVTVRFATSNGSATAGSDYTAVTQTLHFRHGQTSATVLIPLLDDARFEGDETVHLTLTDPTFGAGLGAPSTAVLTIADNDGLIVTGLTPTRTGFQITFNSAIDANVLNLYDVQGGSLGPADVTLTGATTGTIAGSLVIGPTGDQITFIRTGGSLSADTYTVTLRSAANGFRSQLNGELLDGNGDGVAGDNYLNTFPIASPAGVMVSIPDFTRGPGQVVNVPATGTGFPLRLSASAGITSLNLTLLYNPNLLTITAAMALPSGSSVTLNTSTPGRAIINFTDTTPEAGITDFVKLTASVPDSAGLLYTQKHVLDLTAITINGGAIMALDDDGLHVNAYLGDTTGNAGYSTTDALRTQRVAVGLDSGFLAYQLADPVIIADITGNGSLGSTDAARLLQESIGLDRAEIPALPTNPPTIAVSGPDPLLSIPRHVRARPGSLVTVPVNLDRSQGLDSANLAISFDPRLLEVVEVGRGSLTRDFDLFAVNLNQDAGTIRVGLGRSAGTIQDRGAGSVLTIVFRVRTEARARNAIINLRQGIGTTTTQLNEGGLDLNPDPSDEAGDVLDGAIRIQADRRQILARDLVFATAARKRTA